MLGIVYLGEAVFSDTDGEEDLGPAGDGDALHGLQRVAAVGAVVQRVEPVLGEHTQHGKHGNAAS